MLRGAVGLAIVGLLLLGWAQGTSAHPRSVPEVIAPDTFLISAAPAFDGTIAWLLGALVVTLALAGRRSPRRAAALTLAVLLAMLAFETGLHSVHHLGDPEAGCVLAATSAHLAAVAAPTVDVVPAPLAASESLAVAASSALPDRQFRPDEGRAPPA